MAPLNRAVDLAAWACLGLAAHTAVNARRLHDPPVTPLPGFAPLVSVLIPARNEAHGIARCIRAVLASRHVVLEVLVLDDGSTDGTGDVVAGIAATDRRVRLLKGRALPSGWLGKSHACHQLAAAATGQVLAFVDADVVLQPDALARGAALLDSAGLDLVSPYPRQVAVSPGERLIQPLLQWSWLTFLPLRAAERSRRPSLAVANGQLLICRAPAYRAAGGHAAVAGEVIEDVGIARAFKRAGLRATVADGTTMATCRMYGGWKDLRDGYGKSLWAATRTEAGGAAVVSLLLWLYVLPPAAALWRTVRRRPGAATALTGYAAAVAGRVIAARRTGGRSADAVVHPVSVLALAGLWVRSVVLHRTGSLRWKGRVL